jgi:mono/diheme cytochrome c family protein
MTRHHVRFATAVLCVGAALTGFLALAADAPKPVVVPESEKGKKNPVPNVPEALESGKSLFQSQCAMCHGAKGDGRGDIAVGQKMKMPDFTDPKTQARRTDGEMFYILSHGHGDMPAEKRLADQNKWEMILYIRTLASPAATPKG